MPEPWVWTQPGMRVAAQVLDQLPATIADRVWVTVSPTGHIDFQFGPTLPLTERIRYVEEVAAMLGAVPTWREPGSGVEWWFYRTEFVTVDGIDVNVYTHAAADELAPARPSLRSDPVPELAEVGG
jgi:hypothetical protein